MYLSNLKLENIKCFKDLNLDFNIDSETPEWTMILGDNSSGKSSILKAIAIGLCNLMDAESFVNYKNSDFKSDKTFTGEYINKFSEIKDLDKDPILKDIRSMNPQLVPKYCQKGLISIKLSNEKDYINVETPVISHNKVIERIITQTFNTNIQTNNPTELAVHTGRFFACGYGPTRNIVGSFRFGDEIKNFSQKEAFKTLFSNKSELGKLETYLLGAYKKSPERYNRIIQVLKQVFDLKESENIDVRTDGIYVDGAWGKEEKLENLGEGYKTTAAWLLDLFGWALLAEKIGEAEQLEGIILIDELEQHLHPKWQRKIVKKLKDAFPKVQFITTTHSPLVAAGVTDIENARIIVCGNDGTVESIKPKEIKGYRADQILTHRIFDLETTVDLDTEETMKKLNDLYMNGDLTEQEEKTKKELETKLNSILPELGETQKIRDEQSKLRKLIDKLEKLKCE